MDLWSRTSYLLFGSELTTHGGNGAIPTGRDGAASGHQLCQDGRSTCDTQGRPGVAYHDLSMQVITLLPDSCSYLSHDDTGHIHSGHHNGWCQQSASVCVTYIVQSPMQASHRPK